MGAQAATMTGDAQETGAGAYDSKVGMWVFLGSEVMFFTGLIGAYIILRFGASGTWPLPGEVLAVPITAVNTFILICSSVSMVKAFAAIEQAGDVDPALVAGGIKVALLTTATGLLIAIPTNIGYNFFVTRIDKLVLDMEQGAQQILNLAWDMEQQGRLEVTPAAAAHHDGINAVELGVLHDLAGGMALPDFRLDVLEAGVPCAFPGGVQHLLGHWCDDVGCLAEQALALEILLRLGRYLERLGHRDQRQRGTALAGHLAGLGGHAQ